MAEPIREHEHRPHEVRPSLHRRLATGTLPEQAGPRVPEPLGGFHSGLGVAGPNRPVGVNPRG